MTLSIFLVSFYLALSNAAPIAKHVVDMTHTFDESTLIPPYMKQFQMKVVHDGIFKEGLWVRFEEYSSGTHVGTHIDAPSHFVKGGLPIDKLPLNNFIAPAAVIDITSRAERDADTEATVKDLLHWEDITSQSLNGTIILLKSGWSLKWSKSRDFFGISQEDPNQLHTPGLSPEAAQWLVDNRKVHGVGVETFSVDKGTTVNYETHRILLGHGLFVIENVNSLQELPIMGSTVYVIPMKIGNGSGAPVRMFATYEEDTASYVPSDKNEL